MLYVSRRQRNGAKTGQSREFQPSFTAGPIWAAALQGSWQCTEKHCRGLNELVTISVRAGCRKARSLRWTRISL